MSEWIDWHRGYFAGSQLQQRLEVVQGLLRRAIAAAPAGRIQLLSLCAGDGRDVLGVLGDHARTVDITARLVELDPELARTARQSAKRLELASVDVRADDAGTTDACDGAAPANIIMVCGIFGNITDEDVRNTVAHLQELCAPGAAVIWTRGTFAPDLTPQIREWFDESGFEELAFVRIPDTTAAVGMHRLTGDPRPFQPGVRLFTFLPADERPSRRGI
ncbi:MAG: class I SAM-dependent methyltransferase family protein [Candidatus Dormibacteraeota bacterium]|nr:class I SAM-dependent methyltransferase family protein [Candidatus Dormibacteraeota bacterium]